MNFSAGFSLFLFSYTWNRYCLCFPMLPSICSGQYKNESLFHILGNRKKLELQCTHCITDIHLCQISLLMWLCKTIIRISLLMPFFGFHLPSLVHYFCECFNNVDARTHLFV